MRSIAHNVARRNGETQMLNDGEISKKERGTICTCLGPSRYWRMIKYLSCAGIA